MAKMNLDFDKKRDRLSWALAFSLLEDPFIYEVTMMLHKIEDKKFPFVMGVSVKDHNFFLYYNLALVEKLNDKELFAILKHECLHLVLHHCTIRKMLPQMKHNIAADLAVNSLIKNLPEGTLLPPLFKLPTHKSTEWYFANLPESSKSINDKYNEKGESLDSHSDWSEDELMDEIIKQKVEEIERKGKWGTLSSGEVELIKAANIKKQNWKSLSKRFIGNLISKYRTSTRKKPNRRYHFDFPGFKKDFTAKLLIAVDTSGSITINMLQLFLASINNMLEEVEMDLMHFDCDIQKVEPYTKKKKELNFKGRGGTSFEPVVKYFEKNCYDGLIILTDGQAEAPTKPRKKVLWICPPGNKPPVDWGERIVLTTKESK